jgi:hypothetical protein
MSNFSLPDSYSTLEKIPAIKQFAKGEYTLKLDELKSFFPQLLFQLTQSYIEVIKAVQPHQSQIWQRFSEIKHL